nr:hypothetical protein [Tanacetum cinerariifolium]
GSRTSRKMGHAHMVSHVQFNPGHMSWKPLDQSKKHTDKRPDFRETNGPSDHVINWIQWRDYMVAGTTKTPGNHRRRHPFYQSMDELHDCEVVVTLQRHYWTTEAKSNSSNTIYRPWNA